MLRESSTLSAFGIAVSDILYQEVVSEVYVMPGNPDSMTQSYERLEKKIINLFKKQGFDEKDVRLTREGQLRYGRQVNYVSVPVKSGKLSADDVKKIMDDFEIQYETFYGKGSGYRKAGIEMVNLKVYGVIKTVRPALRKLEKKGEAPSLAGKGEREVYLEDTFSRVPIFDWERLEPGNVLSGPAIVESTFTTGVILEHMEGKVDDYLNIHVFY
jgi:N-methylhydantoinase A